MTRAAMLALVLALLSGGGQLAPTAEAQAEAREASADSASAGVVNLNEATSEQLMRLPGIGATRAQAIIDARARRPFRSPRELIRRVRGIGRATYRKLAPFLTVEGPTTLGEP